MRLNQSDCDKCANKGRYLGKIDGLPCNVIYTEGCLSEDNCDVVPCNLFKPDKDKLR